MKTSAKRVASSGAAIAAVAIVVAGVWGVSSAVNSAPEPTPTPTVIEVATHVGTDENGLAGEQEAEAAAAEAARIEAERVAAEAAAAEAARAAAEEAARAAEAERVSQQTVTAPSSGNSGGSQPAPAAPIRCPAGTLANSSDGVNDTSCLAEICFSIAVPDPAHPECDQAFRP